MALLRCPAQFFGNFCIFRIWSREKNKTIESRNPKASFTAAVSKSQVQIRKIDGSMANINLFMAGPARTTFWWYKVSPVRPGLPRCRNMAISSEIILPHAHESGYSEASQNQHRVPRNDVQSTYIHAKTWNLRDPHFQNAWDTFHYLGVLAQCI